MSNFISEIAKYSTVIQQQLQIVKRERNERVSAIANNLRSRLGTRVRVFIQKENFAQFHHSVALCSLPVRIYQVHTSNFLLQFVIIILCLSNFAQSLTQTDTWITRPLILFLLNPFYFNVNSKVIVYMNRCCCQLVIDPLLVTLRPPFEKNYNLVPEFQHFLGYGP